MTNFTREPRASDTVTFHREYHREYSWQGSWRYPVLSIPAGYGPFIVAIALSIEQGAPLVATLGDMSNGLQSEIEPEIKNELLGRGLRTATPMVLG